MSLSDKRGKQKKSELILKASSGNYFQLCAFLFNLCSAVRVYSALEQGVNTLRPPHRAQKGSFFTSETDSAGCGASGPSADPSEAFTDTMKETLTKKCNLVLRAVSHKRQHL